MLGACSSQAAQGLPLKRQLTANLKGLHREALHTVRYSAQSHTVLTLFIAASRCCLFLWLIPLAGKFSGSRELATRLVVIMSLYFGWPWLLFCFMKLQINIHNAQSLLSSVLVLLVQWRWDLNTCLSLKLQWVLTLYERDYMLSLSARETVFNVQFRYYKLETLYFTHVWTCFLSILHSTYIPNNGHILFSASSIQTMSETFCPASTPLVVSSEPLLTH